MTDNLESDQEGLVPSGKREISTDKSDLYQRGLGLIGNLKKKTRTIVFPEDYSIGKLFFQGKEKWPGCDENWSHPAQDLEAQGEVSIPPEVTSIQLHITDNYPHCLSPLSQLNLSDIDSLLISHDQANDHELKHLNRLTKLPELYLSFCYKITDNGFLNLQKLTSLKTLWVLGSLMSDKGLEHLLRLPLLQDLHLDMTRVSNFGLGILKQFPSLRKCILCRSDTIDDAGLINLGQLTKLEELSLCMIKISDTGLSYLRKMDSLQTLELEGRGISDAGLKYLVDLKNLTTLKLFGTSITEAGLTRIKTALPNCIVQSFSEEINR